jgi:hypothetical protein
MSVQYDRYGNVYRMVSLTPSSCLVRRLVRDGDVVVDGELLALPLSALLDSPPRQQVDDEIAAKRSVLSDLDDQVKARREELANCDDAEAARRTRLKEHKTLGRLDDFLAGRITHYVVCPCGYGPPEIVTWEEAKTTDAGHCRDKLKMLTLFGCTNGDLEWRLNCYSDGSGSDDLVIPCVSSEEATEIARQRFAAHEKKALDFRRTPDKRWLNRATKYGITMSDDYVRAVQESVDSARQRQIAELRVKLQELEADND